MGLASLFLALSQSNCPAQCPRPYGFKYPVAKPSRYLEHSCFLLKLVVIGEIMILHRTLFSQSCIRYAPFVTYGFSLHQKTLWYTFPFLLNRIKSYKIIRFTLHSGRISKLPLLCFVSRQRSCFVISQICDFLGIKISYPS